MKNSIDRKNPIQVVTQSPGVVGAGKDKRLVPVAKQQEVIASILAIRAQRKPLRVIQSALAEHLSLVRRFATRCRRSTVIPHAPSRGSTRLHDSSTEFGSRPTRPIPIATVDASSTSRTGRAGRDQRAATTRWPPLITRLGQPAFTT
jgi:hypothetical protein